MARSLFVIILHTSWLQKNEKAFKLTNTSAPTTNKITLLIKELNFIESNMVNKKRVIYKYLCHKQISQAGYPIYSSQYITLLHPQIAKTREEQKKHLYKFDSLILPLKFSRYLY
ncbi:MAG: hypothetical protein HRT87_06055 [Legionellales bacterium]|nr:hypothetical protein [Legionellales bacterium]